MLELIIRVEIGTVVAQEILEKYLAPSPIRGPVGPKSLKSGRTLSEGRDMANCPQCDAPIVRGDQYCFACGTTFQPTGPAGSAPPGSPFAGHARTPPPPPSPFGSPTPTAREPWGQPPFMTSPVATLPPVPGALIPTRPLRPQRSSGVWIAAVVGLIAVAALAVGAVALFYRD
jgi:hypothetical protein